MAGFRDLIRRKLNKSADNGASPADPPPEPNTDYTQAPSDPTPPEAIAPSQSNSAVSGLLWSRAYQILLEREPDLIKNYEKYFIEKAPDGVLSSPATVTKLVERLQSDREGMQWRLSFNGKEHKLRGQVEKLTKLLVFSDAVIKQAISAQPYAALAWTGVSLFLPVSTCPPEAARDYAKYSKASCGVIHER